MHHISIDQPKRLVFERDLFNYVFTERSCIDGRTIFTLNLKAWIATEIYIAAILDDLKRVADRWTVSAAPRFAGVVFPVYCLVRAYQERTNNHDDPKMEYNLEIFGKSHFSWLVEDYKIEEETYNH